MQRSFIVATALWKLRATAYVKSTQAHCAQAQSTSLKFNSQPADRGLVCTGWSCSVAGVEVGGGWLKTAPPGGNWERSLRRCRRRCRRLSRRRCRGLSRCIANIGAVCSEAMSNNVLLTVTQPGKVSAIMSILSRDCSICRTFYFFDIRTAPAL